MKKLILTLCSVLWLLSSTALATNYCEDASVSGCWLFTEGSGADLADSSVNGNDGTITGAAWDTTDVSFHTSGSAPNSLDFDGVDDIVTLDSSIALSAITIVAWIAPDSTGEGTAGRIYHGGSTSNPKFGMYPDNNLSFFEIFTGDDGSWTSANSSITIDSPAVWQHVAITWTGSVDDDPIFYVNGEVSATTEVSTPTGSAEMGGNGEGSFLGNRGSTAATFDGKMTEIAIFNRVLSQGEVQEIYNYGLTASGAPPASRRRPPIVSVY